MCGPNPNQRWPIAGNQDVQFIKNSFKAPNVELGEYSYYAANDGESFQTCILHHYEFLGDKLIIGKFNSFGAGLKIIMNGANHRMDGSTYPFNIFGAGWEEAAPSQTELPNKGDTIIGNDVWLGMNVTIMPGVTIGNGAIVAANSTVVKDVPSFSLVGGNPARLIRHRFETETIAQLEALSWWDWPIEKITKNLAAITSYNLTDLLVAHKLE